MANALNRARNAVVSDGLGALVREGSDYALRRLPRRGVPLYYRYRTRRNWDLSGDYEARPDPFAIVHVSPDRIEYNSGRRFSYVEGRYEDAGLIAGGDWDRNLDRFGERTIWSGGPDTVYRSFVERFDEGAEWEDVPFVRKAFRELDRDSDWDWHGCRSREEILERCRQMDRLFEDIRENGYRSKGEQLATQGGAPLMNPEWFHFRYDEVVVNVGRDGRLLFVGGHHRLSIAKILGLPEIPVRLFVRHRGWQERRDRTRSGETPPEALCSHPDLRDVLD